MLVLLETDLLLLPPRTPLGEALHRALLEAGLEVGRGELEALAPRLQPHFLLGREEGAKDGRAVDLAPFYLRLLESLARGPAGPRAAGEVARRAYQHLIQGGPWGLRPEWRSLLAGARRRGHVLGGLAHWEELDDLFLELPLSGELDFILVAAGRLPGLEALSLAVRHAPAGEPGVVALLAPGSVWRAAAEEAGLRVVELELPPEEGDLEDLEL